MGDGIVATDCVEARNEFFRTNVQPRGIQEFEFLTHGVPRTGYFPYIVTPRMYDYGRCLLLPNPTFVSSPSNPFL